MGICVSKSFMGSMFCLSAGFKASFKPWLQVTLWLALASVSLRSLVKISKKRTGTGVRKELGFA